VTFQSRAPSSVRSTAFHLSRTVWTTLLTNTAYLPGLLTLDYSLKRSKSVYPLIVLYTDELPLQAHEALDRRGIRKRHVPYLLPTASNDYSNDPRFYDCWTKMVPYGLTEYERIVQLDSDMLIMRNMDELMTLDLDPPEMEGKGNKVFAASHACVCNPLKKPHYPRDWYVYAPTSLATLPLHAFSLVEIRVTKMTIGFPPIVHLHISMTSLTWRKRSAHPAQLDCST
jgi:hypothetical protein